MFEMFVAEDVCWILVGAHVGLWLVCKFLSVSLTLPKLGYVYYKMIMVRDTCTRIVIPNVYNATIMDTYCIKW